MVKVYFSRGNELIFIGAGACTTDAHIIMSEDLRKKGIEPYYIRSWGDEDKMILDYGSHTCFYEFHYIHEEDNECQE